jgi:hypothetical protein
LTIRKRGHIWWYDFHNHKYRGPIPEARTKYEAEQAEVKLKRDVFEGKYGKQFGTMLFADFVGNPTPRTIVLARARFSSGPNTTSVRGNMIASECAS